MLSLLLASKGVVVIPAAHALAVGLAGLHTAAIASCHAAGAAKLAGAALHASQHGFSAAAATGTLTAAPAAILVNAPAGTRVITDVLRRPERPASAQAVGRIIQVEVDRLVEAAWFQGSRRPQDVLARVQERLTERGPIITWALDVWMREELSKLPFYNQVVQVCVAYAACMDLSAMRPAAAQTHPMRRVPAQARVPHIWAAVRALEVELTSRAPPP